MKRSADLRFYLLIALIVLVFSSNALLFFYYQQNKDNIKQNHIYELRKEFIITMSVYSDMADSIYHLHIDTPGIKRIFAQGVQTTDPAEKNIYRKRLLYTLNGLYRKLIGYNFRQLHFHEKNNRSFLRFHRPNKFGDDLTGIRYSVEFVNREKKYISGFEEGRIFNGYRFVYPLALKNEHIGSVEISVSMKTLIKQLSQLFDKEAQFIIQKEQVAEKVFKSEISNYIVWDIDDNYVLDRAVVQKCILEKRISDNDAFLIRKTLEKKSSKGNPFCLEISVDGASKVVTFLPIENFLGKKMAYVFSISDNTKLREHARSLYMISAALMLLLVLFIVFTVYYRVSQKKIEGMITYDFLTRALSRRAFFERLDAEFERYRRYRKPFSLIMLDIDHFKKINDKYGHTTGDLILSAIAEIITKSVRKTDHLGRYGGEEFIILLPETAAKDAVTVAENLRKVISEHNFHRAGTVTVSCGVVEIHPQFMSIDEFVNEADKKLYRAKDEGRNRVIA